MEFLFKLTRTLSAPHTGWWWSEQGKSQVAPFFELTRPPWGLFWKSLELLAFLCFPLASPSSSLQSTFRFLRLTLRILERSLSFGTESLLLSSCTWSTKNIFVSPSLGVETQNWLDPRPSRRTVRPWVMEWGERIREMWFIGKRCKISWTVSICYPSSSSTTHLETWVSSENATDLDFSSKGSSSASSSSSSSASHVEALDCAGEDGVTN